MNKYEYVTATTSEEATAIDEEAAALKACDRKPVAERGSYIKTNTNYQHRGDAKQCQIIGNLFHHGTLMSLAVEMIIDYFRHFRAYAIDFFEIGQCRASYSPR